MAVVVTEFKLTQDCKFALWEYGDSKEVYLEYIERQSDPWYSDTETSVTINKEEALKIIELLAEAHGLSIWDISIKGE